MYVILDKKDTVMGLEKDRKQIQTMVFGRYSEEDDGVQE